MVKKLLKHGKYYKRENGDLVVYRAGAIVDCTPAQAKANPDQFVDLPVETRDVEVTKPEVVKPAKEEEAKEGLKPLAAPRASPKV